MLRAMELAQQAWGETHPNPMVGAVIVKNGEIVGEGFHKKAGGPHAEINALEAAGDNAKGSTLYVTLEPCSTFGRTPPCTDAIIRAQIAKVVVGATDPNPLHAGKGYEIMRKAGIEVENGFFADECEDLNPIFNHWITTKQSLFAGKIATTIDGKVATRTRQSKWITGETARENAHKWRRLFPAIGIGSGTLLSDNPRLTARLPDKPEFCPQRFVFDQTLLTAVIKNPMPHVYNDEFRALTTVVTSPNAPLQPEKALNKLGVKVLRLDGTGVQFWTNFRKYCVESDITGVFIEGGPRILSSLLLSDQLDYLYAYRAPVILADNGAIAAFDGAMPENIADGWRLENIHHEALGDDELLRGWVKYGGR
jgi:diaminohydroxyphosphoribosylaminopyrimidine deaminase / 5-amino-6-(5-phosphoribosylamino)uracil reductase